MSKKPENLNTIRQSCGSRVVVNGVNSNRETPYAADTFLLSLQVKVFLYYNMKGQFSYICRKPKLSEYIVYKKNRRDITSYRGNKQHKRRIEI